MENCGISYDSFIDMVGRRWKGPQTSPLAHLERSIIEVSAKPDDLVFVLKPVPRVSLSWATSRLCGITLHGGVDIA